MSYFVLQVKKTVFSAGYQADVDLDHGTTLNKKIRNAQLAQYNFIFGNAKFLRITLISILKDLTNG